ncbi:hypothetical protein HX92_0568 [Mycobacterium tuberculosis]|nr:hypothetical protein [Mycobacterium tuberculosis]KQL74349.1 hypothetical protein HX92_0568 [Mycobacterium tuberculosis]SIP65673.1 hypothetical protein BN9982_2120005 [Mycobacterium tuberculosis]
MEDAVALAVVMMALVPLSAMLAVLSEFGLAAAAEVPLLPEPPLPVT